MRTRHARVNTETSSEELHGRGGSRTGGNQPNGANHDPASRQSPISTLSQLQRTVGNRATVRFLGAAGAANGAAPIMRYPSSVLDKPQKAQEWKNSTSTVKKSGEGVSGGVYFFSSKRGKVKNVAVKAEANSADEKDMAGSLLASAGVSIPKGRNIAVGSSEGQGIVATAAKRGGYNLEVTGQGGSENTVYLEVMSVASGSSLSSKAKKAGVGDAPTVAANIDQLVQLLSGSTLQAQLGDMIARDTILGNTDRVTMLGPLSNIGNIMVSEAPEKKALPRALQSRVTAIDNELDSAQNFGLGAARNALVELAKNPAAFIDRMLGSISFYLGDANPQAVAVFEGHPDYAAMRAGLIAAVTKAAMKEALLGAREKPTGSEKPFEAEMRRRRLVLWNIFSG